MPRPRASQISSMSSPSPETVSRTPAIVIAGPTGIGKTACAVELAQRFPLEIICADSMQVYRGMPIGTAQPTPDECARAKFHLNAIIDPLDPFDAQRFLEWCDGAHSTIERHGAVPCYVGGTGMYLRALRWGLDPEAASDAALRKKLDREGVELGWAVMHARLAAIDPEAARRIHPGDAIRIVRALEIHELTGRKMSDRLAQWARRRPRFPHRLIVLVSERGVLRRRIEARTGAMLREGWIEEVETLLKTGVTPEAHCFKALGYREIADYLAGNTAREALREIIVTRTMQFARRQMIWFRRERPAVWVTMDEAGPERVISQLEKLLANAGIASV